MALALPLEAFELVEGTVVAIVDGGLVALDAIEAVGAGKGEGVGKGGLGAACGALGFGFAGFEVGRGGVEKMDLIFHGCFWVAKQVEDRGGAQAKENLEPREIG